MHIAGAQALRPRLQLPHPRVPRAPRQRPAAPAPRQPRAPPPAPPPWRKAAPPPLAAARTRDPLRPPRKRQCHYRALQGRTAAPSSRVGRAWGGRAKRGQRKRWSRRAEGKRVPPAALRVPARGPAGVRRLRHQAPPTPPPLPPPPLPPRRGPQATAQQGIRRAPGQRRSRAAMTTKLAQAPHPRHRPQKAGTRQPWQSPRSPTAKGGQCCPLLA